MQCFCLSLLYENLKKLCREYLFKFTLLSEFPYKFAMYLSPRSPFITSTQRPVFRSAETSCSLSSLPSVLCAGQEGKQASLAADFSVTQFKHLGRLLMVHGRNSYKRSAALSQFVIHRSLCISAMQVNHGVCTQS